MNRTKIYRVLGVARLVSLAGLGLFFTASGVKAGGCGPVPYKAGAAPSIPLVSPPEDGEWNEPATIVGLWHLIYTGTYSTSGPLPFPVIPQGSTSSFLFVESLKTWHADGTEFENAFLPPAGGNICFGVWKDKGHGSVKLHHIGLMFAPNGDLAFIFTVDEEDTVAANGRTYSGFFDFKLWPPSFGQVGTGLPLQEVKVTTAGARISAD